MRRTLATLLCAALTWLAALPAELPAQGPDEALAAYTSILKARDNRKGERDREAIAKLEPLMKDFGKLTAKQKRKVTRTLADTFRYARREPAQAKLYEAVVESLGKTGEDGAASLRKLFDNKRIAKGPGKIRKQWYPLRASILEALGRCRDDKTAEFLLDTALKNPESDLFLAAAGKALGNFENAPEPQRKEIAHKLIREFNRIYNLANARIGKPDPYDIQTPTFRRRYNAIRPPWNRTLQRLTRQRINKPQDWQRFWNKSKSKPWPKL